MRAPVISADDEVVIGTQGSRAKGMVLSSGGCDRLREGYAGKPEIKAGGGRIIIRPAEARSDRNPPGCGH